MKVNMKAFFHNLSVPSNLAKAMYIPEFKVDVEDDSISKHANLLNSMKNFFSPSTNAGLSDTDEYMLYAEDLAEPFPVEVLGMLKEKLMDMKKSANSEEFRIADEMMDDLMFFLPRYKIEEPSVGDIRILSAASALGMLLYGSGCARSVCDRVAAYLKNAIADYLQCDLEENRRELVIFVFSKMVEKGVFYNFIDMSKFGESIRTSIPLDDPLAGGYADGLAKARIEATFFARRVLEGFDGEDIIRIAYDTLGVGKTAVIAEMIPSDTRFWIHEDILSPDAEAAFAPDFPLSDVSMELLSLIFVPEERISRLATILERLMDEDIVSSNAFESAGTMAMTLNGKYDYADGKCSRNVWKEHRVVSLESNVHSPLDAPGFLETLDEMASRSAFGIVFRKAFTLDVFEAFEVSEEAFAFPEHPAPGFLAKIPTPADGHESWLAGRALEILCDAAEGRIPAKSIRIPLLPEMLAQTDDDGTPIFVSMMELKADSDGADFADAASAALLLGNETIQRAVGDFFEHTYGCGAERFGKILATVVKGISNAGTSEKHMADSEAMMLHGQEILEENLRKFVSSVSDRPGIGRAIAAATREHLVKMKISESDADEYVSGCFGEAR